MLWESQHDYEGSGLLHPSTAPHTASKAIPKVWIALCSSTEVQGDATQNRKMVPVPPNAHTEALSAVGCSVLDLSHSQRTLFAQKGDGADIPYPHQGVLHTVDHCRALNYGQHLGGKGQLLMSSMLPPSFKHHFVIDTTSRFCSDVEIN